METRDRAGQCLFVTNADSWLIGGDVDRTTGSHFFELRVLQPKHITRRCFTHQRSLAAKAPSSNHMQVREDALICAMALVCRLIDAVALMQAGLGSTSKNELFQKPNYDWLQLDYDSIEDFPDVFYRSPEKPTYAWRSSPMHICRTRKPALDS